MTMSAKAMRVWAPKAHKLEIIIDGERREMSPCGDGHFDAPAPKAGARYGFSIDGGAPVPDPRSRSQPDGVHGLSEAVDFERFSWTDADFVPRAFSSAVIMEVHLGTFSETGTFDGAIGKLDHLVELGVTHVELMPVVEFPGRRGWGYDGVDLFAPHHAYGGPSGFARLVDACHARGLAVILDVVYNHLGPSGNYLSQFGPYFTHKHHTPWGDALNFDNNGSDEVRRFFLDNARMWFEDYHVDGLRLDAVHAIVDGSALHFLEELAREVRVISAALGKDLVLIAESDLNDPRIVRPLEAHGYGMTAQWSDDFHHAVHAWLTGETTGYYADFGGIAPIARALTQGYVYAGAHAKSRGRRHGRPLGGLSGHALLAYTQTHDQIGNRAQGDRLAALAGIERAQVGLALVLTSPFVPMLFAGEEWGSRQPFCYFTDHEDQALGQAVRDGRRREFAAFGWKPEDVPDPQADATFQASKLAWAELEQLAHRRCHAFVRQLLELRARFPALKDGALERVQCSFDEERAWLVVRRAGVFVVCNLGPAQKVPLPSRPTALLLASKSGVEIGSGGVAMPSEAVAVLHDGEPSTW